MKGNKLKSLESLAAGFPELAAPPEAPEWEMTREDLDDSWMVSLKPVFKYFEARTPEASGFDSPGALPSGSCGQR